MFARKCDRCGRLYENYVDVDGSAIYAFNRDDMGQAMENQVYVKDLCPDCMEEFRNFMDGWTVIKKDSFVELITDRAKKELAENENEMLKREITRLTGETPVVLDGENLKPEISDELSRKLREGEFE